MGESAGKAIARERGMQAGGRAVCRRAILSHTQIRREYDDAYAHVHVCTMLRNSVARDGQGWGEGSAAQVSYPVHLRMGLKRGEVRVAATRCRSRLSIWIKSRPACWMWCEGRPHRLSKWRPS